MALVPAIHRVKVELSQETINKITCARLREVNGYPKNSFLRVTDTVTEIVVIKKMTRGRVPTETLAVLRVATEFDIEFFELLDLIQSST